MKKLYAITTSVEQNHDERDLLNEAFSRIKSGSISGFDSNITGSVRYSVTEIPQFKKGTLHRFALLVQKGNDELSRYFVECDAECDKDARQLIETSQELRCIAVYRHCS